MVYHFDIMKPLLNLQNEIKNDHFLNGINCSTFAGRL